jgi:hypothetical protein
MNGFDENRARLNALKQLLEATDYKALKYAEGRYTEEEYAPTKAQRQAWREEVNALEAEIAAEAGEA